MLKSNLCDYSDAYILVSGAITVTGAVDNDAAGRLDEKNKGVIFKHQPFADFIREINKTQIDNTKYIDVAMSMDNLIEYNEW